MTLIEHFEELRNRLFIAMGAWVVAATAGYIYRNPLLDWLKEPLSNAVVTVVSTQLLEQFLVSMQIAAFAGLVLASPIIVGQVWGFIAPGLYKEERRWAIPFILFTAVAFVGGVAFARYVVLPFALPIIVGFLNEEVTTLLSIGDYISKVLLYMAVFGILFEMPVLGFLLGRLGILYSHTLTQFRRYSIVVGCVVAALITPTADPFNFALVAIPLVILYELTIIVVRLSQRRDLLEEASSS